MTRTMNRLTLELSLKPFTNDLSRGGIARTCKKICDNWTNLAERFQHISILLWVSDGNDIFDWSGDLDSEMTWAQSINFCNNNDLEVYEPSWNYPKSIPYRENLPKLHYRDLRLIITTLRKVFFKRFKKKILIGATIDPGPEFAEAKFKIQRHPEVLSNEDRSKLLVAMHFMSHQAILKGDTFKYAAFPRGLPEGTSLGTFIGSQFEATCSGLGFDYLWLSNGFGYTHNAWSFKGRCFYGDYFDSNAASNELSSLKKFWIDFRKAVPKRRIEVRGSNFTVGMDISVDGISHKAIHKLGRIAIAPPNLPNLDEEVGREIACLMSRIAKPITRETLFRFYLNDPWFPCNPWFDRFNRETFDIYCPSSVSRILPDASVEPISNFSILSIDTEDGGLPKDEANEVTPHFLRAFREAPDQAGPIILVYPYDEYHQILERKNGPLGLPFAHDWFLVHAIGSGLPVNTVMSSDSFANLQSKGLLPDALYIAPAPLGHWPCSSAFLNHVAAGGQMLLYGSLAGVSREMLDMLGLELTTEGAEGLFSVLSSLETDFIQGQQQEGMRPLLHRAVVSGGPLLEKSRKDIPLVEVSQGGKSFAYAIHRHTGEQGNGGLSWIRGSTHFDPTKYMLTPGWDSPSDFSMCGAWMRALLAKSGWRIRQDKQSQASRDIYSFIKRFDNAFYFTGHKPDSSSRLLVSSPFGAPIFSESETILRDGLAEDSFGKSFYNEVRAFVRMPDGVVKCKEMPPDVGFSRHMVLSGLKNPNLLFFPSLKAFNLRRINARNSIYGGAPIKFEWNETLRCINFKQEQIDSLSIMW